MENLVIAGSPSILIRCGCDFKIGNTIFKENQIVSIINNCDVSFSYGTSQKNIAQRAAVLGYNENVELNRISISSVPFNKMMYKLIFGKENNEDVWKPNVFSAIPDNKIIALPTSEAVKNIDVYDTNYNIINFNFDKENNTLSVDTDEEVIVCYYNKIENGIKINTMPSQLPYFRIECINKGNSIGENNRFPIIQYMKLYRCALNMEPFFLFNDNITNFDLVFNIIKDDRDTIEYGKE